MSRYLTGLELVAAANVELARAPADIDAVLTLATSTLSRLRPGTWVAVVMNPDVSTSRVVVADDRDQAMAQYVKDYVATIDGPGRVPTIGLSQQVIESGIPLIKKVDFDDLLKMLSPAAEAYCRANPPPGPISSIDIAIVPMRVGGATLGTLGLLDARSRDDLAERDADWMQIVADRIALSVDYARLFTRAIVSAAVIDVVRTFALAYRHGDDPQLMLAAMVERVTAQPDVDAADIVLLEKDGSELVIAATGFRSAQLRNLRVSPRWAPPEHHATRRDFNRRLSARMNGITRLPRLAREGFKTVMGIPLLRGARMVGTLNLYSRTLVEWDEERIQFFEAVGSLVATTIGTSTRPNLVTRRTCRAALNEFDSEILRLISEGYTNKEIATQLHRSASAIKYHVRRMLENTEAANRTDLVRCALQEGWISPPTDG
ncbi:MAG TPA: GAF domain-containing protein [Candidatus Dormibacteraeota bacterium]|nr:GAF domain-containing protein [Candidatus Dormibacteraeota bacterium]